MFELVIATNNLHKLRELRSILREPTVQAAMHGAELDLLSLRDYPQYEPLPEGDDSFRENALAKAVHAAKALGRPVLADDSGLCVPALDGAPGVRSARFAGPGASDKDLRRALLSAMSGLAQEQRQAWYECWLAFALPSGEHWVSQGVCEGEILVTERGADGFGYDALFLKFDYGKTFGELSEALKNRISHRRRAFDRILPHLVRHCTEQSLHVDH